MPFPLPGSEHHEKPLMSCRKQVVGCKPVGYYKPRGSAAKAVRAVAEELMARLAAPAAGTGEAA
jgi:hypothetical protein